MKHKSIWRGLVTFLVALFVIAVDQYTKALVRRHLTLNVSWNPIPWLDPIVTLTHTQNRGMAFGLFPGVGPAFMVVALGVVVAIIVYYRQLTAAPLLLRVAIGLQLGGAIGNNLIDRLLLGYVTDFIDIRVWPIFNVADSSVVVGTILLAYYALFVDTARERERKEPREPQANPEEAH